MNIQIGISESNQQAVANALAKTVAADTALYFKPKKINWNIEQAAIHDKHAFFTSHLSQLDDMIDKVAARLSSLGQ